MDSGIVPNDVTTDDNSAENNKLSKDTEAISNVEAANEANDDNDDDDISFSHASNDDVTQDDMDEVESARPSFSGLSVDIDESVVDR